MIFNMESPLISLRSLENYFFEFYIYLHRIIDYFGQREFPTRSVDLSENISGVDKQNFLLLYLFISTYFSTISSNADCVILSMLSSAASRYIKGVKRKFPFARFSVRSFPAKS